MGRQIGRSLSKLVIEDTAQIMVHVGYKEQDRSWIRVKLKTKGTEYLRKTQKMYRCKINSEHFS